MTFDPFNASQIQLHGGTSSSRSVCGSMKEALLMCKFSHDGKSGQTHVTASTMQLDAVLVVQVCQ